MSGAAYSLRAGGITDAAEASALFDRCLGVIPGRVEKMWERLAAGSLRLMLCEQDGHMVAAGTYSVGIGDLLAEDGELWQPGLGTLPEATGWLEGEAVVPTLRRQGIGWGLLMARAEELACAGVSTMLALAWRPPGRWGDEEKLLRAAGFVERAAVRGYWARPGATSNYCPYCGRDCSCEAVLFRRDPM